MDRGRDARWGATGGGSRRRDVGWGDARCGEVTHKHRN